ncbi:hypothetical protein P8452_39500 [Trifolium repens]|nr:hypothetical protein P8452_39500 [Trifolium repens]
MDVLKDRLQCVDDPGKRSRLWKASDIYNVLSKNKGKGTDAIRCISLNMEEIKKVQLHADTFKKMHNLRMIKFHTDFFKKKKKFHTDLIEDGNGSSVTFDGFLKSFPNDLKFLQWDGYPQRSLPQDFCPENLATLDMSFSHLEKLWEGDQVLPNLKRLDLSYSSKLIAVPDLSFSPNIEEVILSGCVSLTQVYSSIFLNKLNFLCLDYCTKLKSINIPSNILSRSSGFVSLRDCRNLETLLISSRIDHVVQSYKFFCGYSMVEEMQTFCVEMGIEIELNDEGDYEICESFSDTLSGKRINEFCWLDASYCGSLTCLPAELLNLKFLTGLSLSRCLKLEELPEIMEIMENLKVLNLDETSIKELPSSLHHLVGLQKLSLKSCTKLKTIPSSIGNLSELLKLNLAGCASLETFPSSLFKLKLTKLNFKGCSMLATFPEILERAESFTCIDLTDTAVKELPSSLHLLVGLEELYLQGCTKLKTIPSSIRNLSKLLWLDLDYCKSLETFPSSIFKLNLTELNFEGCSMLQTFPKILEPTEKKFHINLANTGIKELPSSLCRLVWLKKLNLKSCTKLKTIPSSIGNLSRLLELNLTYCASLETFPSSIFKLNLTELNFEGCSMLQTFPKIPNDIGRLSSLTEILLQGSNIVNLPKSIALLSSLRSLNLSDCKLLERVPKLPPNLNQVLAYDCPSIKRMMLNSRSDPGEGAFKFHLTNSQYSTSLSNIGEEACIKITDDEYRSVVFCFPGSAVPRWFQYCCKGHSVTMTKDSPNLCSKSRLIGFALCAVLRPENMDESFIYKFEFISEGEIYSSSHCLLKNYLNWNCPDRSLKQDHTFLWKHDLYLEAITNKLFHAQDFTFEFPSKGKEYGICPLYTKEIYTLKNRVGPKLQNCVV